MKEYFNIWNFLSKRRKRQSLIVLLLMVISSISEVISIGSILPFLGVITSPDLVYNHELMIPIINFFGWTYPDEIILPVTVIFITVILFSSLVRLLLIYTVLKFSYAIGADLSIDMYRRTLYQNYSVHISRNSSEIISGIINKTAVVTGGVLTPLLYFFSSIIILTGILFTLFLIDPLITSISISFFGSIYFLISIYTKKSLEVNGKRIAYESTQIVKSLQEGLGGIRDVLLDNSQEFYCKLYRNADIPLRHASASNSFISTGPRYLIEAIGVSLIAGMAYLMSREASNVATVIPVLGVFAMGAQRLLPVLQQIYASISTLRGAKSSFNDVKELLEQPLPTNVFRPVLDNLEFKSRITLNEVCFRYSKETPWIINKINLTINKGDVVGFVGKTGSGKSTLIDIIMGLLQPSSGKLLVDDVLISPKILRNWQSLIAHVPQSVYLSDASVLENIAFGISKNDIDIKRVIFSAKKAHIFDFIQSLPKKFETVVGEQGVKLSGGQKQRIGIARALYKKSKVIVFDEATSALDNDTEKAVMKAINGLDDDVTILIIAHRTSTLRKCNKIFQLGAGNSIKEINYNDLLKQKTGGK